METAWENYAVALFSFIFCTFNLMKLLGGRMSVRTLNGLPLNLIILKNNNFEK